MKLVEVIKTRWIVWVWNHTPNCAEMSRLTSRAFEHPPSLRLRFRMWLHHLICVWCKRYTRHLKFLHRTAPEWREEAERTSPHKLSNDAKQRMVERLHEEERRH